MCEKYWILRIIIIIISMAVPVTISRPGLNVLKPKALILFMDGLRWDFISRTSDTPNFDYMAATGVEAEALVPVFPANTYPNIVTAMTGLYPESHGIVENYIYDPHTRQTMKDSWSRTLEMMEAEPLSTTMRKRGIRAMLLPDDMMNKPLVLQSIKQAVRALVDDETDCVMMNIQYPDHVLHFTGLNEWILGYMIHQLDVVMGEIFKDLRHGGMLDSVDVILFGDHGIVPAPKKNSVDVKACLGQFADDVILIGSNIHCDEVIVDDVYDALRNCHPHLHVYRPNELPKRMHYRNNDRIGQLVIMLDLGWYRPQPEDDPLDEFVIARHGYDYVDRNMQAAFYARGPHFRRNYKIPAFSIIHLYSIACHILGIEPLPNNGSLDAVRDMLAP